MLEILNLMEKHLFNDHELKPTIRKKHFINKVKCQNPYLQFRYYDCIAMCNKKKIKKKNRIHVNRKEKYILIIFH